MGVKSNVKRPGGCANSPGPGQPAKEAVMKKSSARRAPVKPKAPKVCRDCGGYGAFLWGASKVADCGRCGGTGRAKIGRVG